MSNTQKAGVSHDEILMATSRVRIALPGYDWDCMPGRWLTYLLLLAMLFSAKVVRPTAAWVGAPRRKYKGVTRDRDLSGMPAVLPVLPAVQFGVPELVGQMFDSVMLSSDVERPVADMWSRHTMQCLYDLGRVVRPLRVAAEVCCAAARVAEARDLDDDRSTSSPMSSLSSLDSESRRSSTDSDSVSASEL